MEKKELRWYESPAVEVVELDAKVSLLAASDEGGGTPWDPDDSEER